MCGFFMNRQLTIRNLIVNKRITYNQFVKNKHERKSGMKIRNNKSKKIIKFLNGKGFYAVVGVCLIAIGVAAWSGVQGIKGINTPQQSEISSSDIISVPDSAELENDKTNEPIINNDNKTENESIQQSTETTEEKEEGTLANTATFFINPVLGDIIKDFSDTELQYSMTFGDMRLHKGIDIAADVGTPVMAAGEGVVLDVYTDALYGAVVEIDHGNGITAKYCGLNSKPGVNVGETVTSSTQIGAIDVVPCESVEQHHLHLEFFKDKKAVSPLKYITQ